MALLFYLFIFKYCIGLDIAIISLLWILVCEKAAYVENYETGHKYGTISYSKYSERAEWYYNAFLLLQSFYFGISCKYYDTTFLYKKPSFWYLGLLIIP